MMNYDSMLEFGEPPRSCGELRDNDKFTKMVNWDEWDLGFDTNFFEDVSVSLALNSSQDYGYLAASIALPSPDFVNNTFFMEKDGTVRRSGYSLNLRDKVNDQWYCVIIPREDVESTHFVPGQDGESTIFLKKAIKYGEKSKWSDLISSRLSMSINGIRSTDEGKEEQQLSFFDIIKS